MCENHSLRIAFRMAAFVRDAQKPADADDWPDDAEFYGGDPTPVPRRPAFVYYLMLTPTTVKIGTTRDLVSRITTHGSKLQYVVALERGSYDIEKSRHDQFPMERHGIKEVFTISDALRRHIETLTPQRDELMAEAIAAARPFAHGL